MFPIEELIKNAGKKFLTYFLYTKGIIIESKKSLIRSCQILGMFQH